MVSGGAVCGGVVYGLVVYDGLVKGLLCAYQWWSSNDILASSVVRN